MDARQNVNTDSEALVRVVEYNADLIERNADRKIVFPTGFPTRYSADAIETTPKREAVADDGIPSHPKFPETGFPAKYKGDLIDA